MAAAAASLVSPSSAQCSLVTFTENRVYSLCSTLPRLSSSLHWNYDQTSRTVDLAFRAHLSAPGWIAWGINPSAARMVGTQALVAVISASGNVTAYPSPITSYSPSITRGNLTFNVTSLSATYSGGIAKIFAVISLPGSSTVMNHVWQSSSILSGDVPGGHLTAGDNVLSIGTLDWLSGESPAALRYLHRKRVHAILCVVGWGILTPLAVLFSRYIRIDSINILLSIVQSSPLIIGAVGWAFGLVLGKDSPGIIHVKHLIIGTIVLCLGTRERLFFVVNVKIVKRVNIDLLGITLVSLSIINIFEGFSILGGHEKWRTAYIAVISSIGGLFVIMEVLFWIYFPKITLAIARYINARYINVQYNP